MNNKILTALEAVDLIQSGDTVTVAGFVGTGVPDELLDALQKKFSKTQTPQNLCLLFTAGPGDGHEKGLNRIADKKLVKRTIGGHYGLIPRISQLALDNEIEAYNIPQGIISHLYRDIAAGKPGVITKTGLGTFADPRIEGGKVNKKSLEDLIKLIDIQDQEYLFVPSFAINVAILRGSVADPMGNISMRKEALRLDNLAQAMATKNSNGKVIVQVESICKELLPSREVEIPSSLVDCIVVAREENHYQTYATLYSPYLDGSQRKEVSHEKSLKLDYKKIIARRAFLDLPETKETINLGIGTPEVIADVAQEEGRISEIILTTEAGVCGGQPAGGLSFGAGVNTDAIICQNQQFDFYDGGGIHTAFLGMAQADGRGDVNVSRFSGRLAGAGGFVNISSSARNLVFCGAFSTGGLNIKVHEGKLKIVNDGKVNKFVKQVEQITFCGALAESANRSVKFVTERAVFVLREGRLHLTEIAPGINIGDEILKKMEFQPVVEEFTIMNNKIFCEGRMAFHKNTNL